MSDLGRSVRKDDDAGGGPAEPIEALAKASGSGTWTDADVERVCMCTGVWDKDVVRAALARGESPDLSVVASSHSREALALAYSSRYDPFVVRRGRKQSAKCLSGCVWTALYTTCHGFLLETRRWVLLSHLSPPIPSHARALLRRPRSLLLAADGNVDEAVEALVAQVAGVDEGVDEDGDESAAEKTDGQAAQGDRKPCEEIPDGEAGQDYWRLPKGDASESGEGGARRGGGVEGRIDAGAEGPSGAEGYGARERESVGGVSGMAQQGAGSQGECSGESRGEDGKRNGCRDEVGVGEGRDGQIDGAGGVKGDRDYGDCSGREEKGVEGEEGEVAVRVGGRKARVKEGRGRPAERGPFPNRPCPCGSKKKYKQCCGAAGEWGLKRC